MSACVRLCAGLQPREHDSVQRTKTEQEKPIDVYECLKAFMKEEELGEEDPWCVGWGVEGEGWMEMWHHCMYGSNTHQTAASVGPTRVADSFCVCV